MDRNGLAIRAVCTAELSNADGRKQAIQTCCKNSKRYNDGVNGSQVVGNHLWGIKSTGHDL